MGDKVTRRTFNPDWIIFPADPEGRACSPVKEYKLSPEELAEYDNLRKPTGKAPIKLPPGRSRNRKEDEEMYNLQNESENMPKNMPENMPTELDNTGQEVLESPENQETVVFDKEENPDTTGQEPPRPRTRLEVARDKLSLKEYQELKDKGKTDHEIKILFKIASDVLVKLKKEWGLPVVSIMPSEQKGAENTMQPDPPPEESQVRHLVAGLTITQALALRNEMTEDVASLNRILDVADRGAELTDRVVRILEWQRDIHQAALDRINEVFNSTVVPL